MNHYRYSYVFAAILAVSGPVSDLVAQHHAGARETLTPYTPEVGPARLKADLSTPADSKDKSVYLRHVTLENDGLYHVVIKDEWDRVRMTGQFLDEQCRVADGSFTYYHSNGVMESTGLFAKGLKSGTWYCYQIDGSPRAERNYSGLHWEDLLVALGLASRAATLGPSEIHVQ